MFVVMLAARQAQQHIDWAQVAGTVAGKLWLLALRYPLLAVGCVAAVVLLGRRRR